MFIFRKYKVSGVLVFLVLACVFYISLRLMSEFYVDGALSFSLEAINSASDSLFDFNAIKLNQVTLIPSFLAALFGALLYYSYESTYKHTIEGKTYGTAEWASPSDLDPYRDKEFDNNIILTKTESVSRNMGKSERNRNIVLLGRPGTGKSRYFFKPNILNAQGTLVITDPKGELLRDCGHSLEEKGYDIKVLNLDEKFKSDRYNPLDYIKKIPKEAMSLERAAEWTEETIAEDDVMSLIDVIFKNTKGDIENQTGDPFWEKAEMIYLRALIYFVLFRLPDDSIMPGAQRNFASVLELIRKSEPDPQSGESELDKYFDDWAAEDPRNIGVKQYKHFKVAASSPKMMSTIIMTATARLASLNIREIEDLISTDSMELRRIGMPISNDPELQKQHLYKDSKGKLHKDGRIAYFVITKPGDSAFNFIANIMYTQVFKIIDQNAFKFHGSLPTPCDLYMDEWAQQGEIPRFVEQLAYVRGLNCGIVIGLQSLSQLKKVYKDSWETALDCCDYILFLGSQSKETLEYMSKIIGRATMNKKTTGRTFGSHGSTNRNNDEVGRDLATIDELSRMEKGHCILKVSGLNVFYSELYDLTKHPRYNMLYEPWNKNDSDNAKRMYDHLPKIRAYEEDLKVAKIFNEAGMQVSTDKTTGKHIQEYSEG